MGMIEGLIRLLAGDRNTVREVAEVFRVNAEAEAQRGHDQQAAALAQLAAEFSRPQKTMWDSFIDGLNRVPRPAMAFGVIGLFVAAMVDPVWFGERMTGLAAVPEPLWWLLGAIVSFYFGARHQARGQDFQRQIAATIARAPTPASPRSEGAEDEDIRTEAPVLRNTIRRREAANADSNPALAAWLAQSK